MKTWYIENENGDFWNEDCGWAGFAEATMYGDGDRNDFPDTPVGGVWKQAQRVQQNAIELVRRSEADRMRYVIEKAIESLNNVPCVGEVYDQQHSDTHLRAVLMLQGALHGN